MPSLGQGRRRGLAITVLLLSLARAAPAQYYEETRSYAPSQVRYVCCLQNQFSALYADGDDLLAGHGGRDTAVGECRCTERCNCTRAESSSSHATPD